MSKVTLNYPLFDGEKIIENASVNVLDNIENNPRVARGMLSPEYRETNLPMLQAVKAIADEKGISLSQLVLVWSLAKYDYVQSLVGTTNPDHLQSAIDSLKIEFIKEDIERIEAAIPADKFSGRGMRNFRFTNGQMSLA